MLEDLLSKLKGKTKLLWLRGISGVGKTALAECLAVKAWEETNPFHWVSLEIFAGQIPDFTTGAAAILAKLGDIDIDPQERNDPKRMCDRLISSASEKVQLARQYQAGVVDMESAAALAVLERVGIPVAAVNKPPSCISSN